MAWGYWIAGYTSVFVLSLAFIAWADGKAKSDNPQWVIAVCSAFWPLFWPIVIAAKIIEVFRKLGENE